MRGLKEADFDSPENDHLGDYTQGHGDPYPATQDAWAKVTVPVHDDLHADPAEIQADMDRYATQPMHYARPVRIAAANAWGALSYLLADGAQGFRAVDDDPNRRATTIYNHSTGPIFIAPTSSRAVGAGSMLIPGRDTTGAVHSRRLETSDEVWVFTLPAYIAGTEPVQVSCQFERYES